MHYVESYLRNSFYLQPAIKSVFCFLLFQELNGVVFTGSRDDTVIAWDEFTADPVRVFEGRTDEDDEDTYSIYAIQVLDAEPL